MVRSFFTYSCILKEIARIYITHLLKTDHSYSIYHCRSINIWNIIGKIIYKSWQTNLRKFFIKLSPLLLGAFIYNRDIYNNILVAHRILNSFLKNKIIRILWRLNYIWNSLRQTRLKIYSSDWPWFSQKLTS